MVSRAVKFLTEDIWRISLNEYSRTKSFFIRQLRVIVLAARGFDEDKCSFRASGLTFYMLISIVPIIAMMFGIAQGFGLQARLKEQIQTRLAGQEEIANKLIQFSSTLLEKSPGGIIAGVGIIFLLWAVIKVLSHIEKSFNEIWGVTTHRSFGRKFSDYLSFMLVCPILLVIAGSITAAIRGGILEMREDLPILDLIGPVFTLIIKFLPLCTLWLTFTFIFIFMPNTKVKFKSGLLAGIVVGTVFQIVQWAYFTLQIGVSKYSAIYGSFAALPLFLFWLQTSWLVILFGGELCFAHQNVETYEFEHDSLSVSYSHKKKLSLLITQLLVDHFCKGQPPLTASDISSQLEIPMRLVRQILSELVEAKVICEVNGNKVPEAGYHPARDVEDITLKFVIDSLEHRGSNKVPVIKSNELEKITNCLNNFGSIIESSPDNVSLKNI
ncbi:MAG: YhjD/YihY/BrkB family envelope integrity protein [Planctomycetota bacterium]|jgi:membrane protein